MKLGTVGFKEVFVGEKVGFATKLYQSACMHAHMHKFEGASSKRSI